MKEVSKKEPLISVIIPVYKVEEYLDKCVSSVIEQTYKNLEIILVDDGSPDNCPKMCDDWAKKDNRIKVIHKKNGGVSSARNIGIKESKGEWITFIDSDDWIDENFIKKLYQVSLNNKSDVVISSYYRVTNDKYEKINTSVNILNFNNYEYLIKALNPQTGYGFCHMRIIKKEKINNFYFDEELKVTEDALFNIKLAKNIKNVSFLGEPLYYYRINNQSVVKKYDKDYPNKYLEGIKKIKKYIFSEYSNKDILQNYYNFVAYHVMLIAVNYCYNYENEESRKIKLLRNICKISEYNDGIKNSNYQNISLTRKITLFTLKHKLYFLTGMICNYRQKQNNS